MSSITCSGYPNYNSSRALKTRPSVSCTSWICIPNVRKKSTLWNVPKWWFFMVIYNGRIRKKNHLKQTQGIPLKKKTATKNISTPSRPAKEPAPLLISEIITLGYPGIQHDLGGPGSRRCEKPKQTTCHWIVPLGKCSVKGVTTHVELD